MADRCDSLRTTLQNLEEQLKNTEKYLCEPGDCMHPVINPEWRELDRRVGATRVALRECEESLILSTPVPLTLTLTKFVCLDQSDEFGAFGINTEHDEPYALVFAVDIKPPLGAGNSKMTLVGPLADVDEGEEYDAPANVIWGLDNNAPSLVSSADNLIVLVVMMENDSGSPEQARTILEGAAQAKLISNVPLLLSGEISRQELVNRIVAEMNGALPAAMVGLPNPDNNIGAIQELRFSQDELDHIYRNLGPIERGLTFEGEDAKYVLKFKMFR
jgi:hypothetical protein